VSDVQGGLRGGGAFERVTFFPCFLCCLNFCVHCWEFFWHMVFANGFLFLVKELGLLTNPGHWVRVLDATGSYMYIVL
jgi:hypothetical protein